MSISDKIPRVYEGTMQGEVTEKNPCPMEIYPSYMDRNPWVMEIYPK